jgi:chromosome segregation ATPase
MGNYQEYIKNLNHISNKTEEVLKNKIKTLEIDLKKQNKHNIELDVNLKQLHIDFKNLTNSFEKIKKENNKVFNELDSAKKTILDKQNQISSLITKQKETVFELISKNSELEKELNENAVFFSKKEKEYKTLTTQNNNLKGEIKNKNISYNNIIKNNEVLGKDKLNLEQENLELMELLSDHIDKNNELVSNMSSFEGENQELNSVFSGQTEIIIALEKKVADYIKIFIIILTIVIVGGVIAWYTENQQVEYWIERYNNRS